MTEHRLFESLLICVNTTFYHDDSRYNIYRINTDVLKLNSSQLLYSLTE